MTATFPEQPFGFVAGRWVVSIGDTPADPDRAPDYVPVNQEGAQIVFTPALSHRVVPDGTLHAGGWSGIIKAPVVATLGPDGQLQDAEKHDHIALAVGTYSVSYRFGQVAWPSHYIEVRAEHTVEAPLWLPTESPLPTGPGVVQVVTEATRIAAEEAAARAEAAALSAWEAVDTPGRVGPEGPEGPQGPPGEVTTAALTTALAGKVTGTGMTVRVDTTVGTRVLLDHPGGTLMLSGDTGWRDISALIDPGWHPVVSPRRLLIRRVGNRITFDASILRKTAGPRGGTGTRIIDAPTGFTPTRSTRHGVANVSTNIGLLASFNSTTSIDAFYIPGTWADGDRLDAGGTWLTSDPWPTTLPGTPSA